jgi:uncharacterized protein (DUF1800 family)
LPRQPYGRYPWHFEYREEDHDDGEKTFLGESGNLNGDDIIDIVVQQPATARFICRHMYNFFVADEPQVPSWTIEPARDEEALDAMMTAFEENNYEIKPLLRMMFNAEFFKNARFSKIKSPAEVVAGTLKMVEEFQFPEPGILQIGKEPSYMGQAILDPPSVEGWHTGTEWINSGSLLARVNFVADRVANIELPGIQKILQLIKEEGAKTPEQVVDAAAEHMGFVELGPETRDQLIENAKSDGDLDWSNEAAAGQRIGEIMALIGATTEYQFG